MKENVSSKKIATGFLWKFSERISAQLVTFVISLVLARLLEPEYYGAIAMVNIFITIANVFVSSGFGNALIQKKDSDHVDFSSVFYFNFVLSIMIYIVIYMSAPFLSKFYEMPILTPVFRIMGLRLIVAGINSVQHAYVSRHMLFKKFFFSTLGGTLLSGVVGIILAYSGFGIWALVAQYMVNTVTDTVVLFITVRWKPTLDFSFSRLKRLISYGWKLLASELINTGYIELRSLIIGKKYSSSDLAHYTKGQSFPKLAVVNINGSIQSVLFPVMSNVQDDKYKIKVVTRKSIRINSYIVVPLIVGLALVAKPMIRLVLTDKWLPCVPYLQLYCLFYCLMPVQTANLQAIKAVGRSDIYLKLEVLKKLVGIIALLIAMPFGTFIIAVSAVAANVFSILMNTVPNKNLLNYSFKEQICDYFNGVLPLCIMVGSILIIGRLSIDSLLFELISKVIVGAVAYIVSSLLLKNDSFMYMLKMAKNMLKKI